MSFGWPAPKTFYSTMISLTVFNPFTPLPPLTARDKASCAFVASSALKSSKTQGQLVRGEEEIFVGESSQQ